MIVAHSMSPFPLPLPPSLPRCSCSPEGLSWLGRLQHAAVRCVEAAGDVGGLVVRMAPCLQTLTMEVVLRGSVAEGG